VQSSSSDSTRLYIYAASILVATIAQFLLPLPWLRGLDGQLHMAIDIHDPAVKRVFTLMVPVTIGLGLININAVIDQLFATHYLDKTLAPAAIVRAFRLYMLPRACSRWPWRPSCFRSCRGTLRAATGTASATP
jgi:putative peptidoglycan lipid II flippase